MTLTNRDKRPPDTGAVKAHLRGLLNINVQKEVVIVASVTLPTFAQLRTLQQQKAPHPVQIALTFHPVHTVTAEHLIISGDPRR